MHSLENRLFLIRVALDVPVDGMFDYLAQDVTRDDIGCRVAIPFGRNTLLGVIMELPEQSQIASEKLKRALRVFRETPPLNHEALELLRFCSRYYHHPLGEVVLNSLPSALRAPKPVRLEVAQAIRLTESGRSQSLPARSRVMQQIRDALLSRGSLELTELKRIASTAPAAFKKMLEQGLVEQSDAAPENFSVASGPILNEQQKIAVASVLAEPRPWLLYGVTGSGKSEVYLRLVESMLERNRQSLLLVPEINLTPQLEALFRSRFPGSLVVSLHSAMAAGARAQNWLLAQSGRARIILGTRLAVFTPLPELGLIIVDEEHDPSFKQQEGLRYSARDVAIFRADRLKIPVLLGTATPSLESLHNAQQGRFGLLRLTQRAVENATLPAIRYVDTRTSICREGLAEPLLEAISARLSRAEQSLVFVNRRGFAPVLMCGSCSWISKCHRCSSRLVLHLRARELRCHYCGLVEAPPVSCPDCGNLDLRPVGHGTQRVEAVLNETFPQARILRIDRDSTRNRNSWQQMLEQIHAGEVDILVGTQILAKGHDFPNLSLVGVLNPDSAFYSTDFRATERLFAQLIQVSGRAGRAGLAGEVLIQTEHPDHPLYRALGHHDYDSIAALLLAERKSAGFPPFIHQALLRAEAEKIELALAFLEKAASLAEVCAEEVVVFEPTAANMMRLSNLERAQLLIQSDSRRQLQRFLHAWLPQLKTIPSRGLRWHVDVDPMEF